MIDSFLNLRDFAFDIRLLNCFAVLAISIIITGILIPKILLISFRNHLFDVPDARKIHHGSIPRLGGMAFTPAIILSMSIVAGVNLLLFGDDQATLVFNIYHETARLCFGLCALMMMYLIGIADDLIGVKYRAKFVVQILAAILLFSSGLEIRNLHGFLGIWEMNTFFSFVFTVIMVVLIINAVNLIDGIDGLASGLSAIAFGFYAFVTFWSGDYIYCLISLGALGTLVPFFYYNVFGDERMGKKIFMGDTGALTTGLLLAFVAIKVNQLPTLSLGNNVSVGVAAFSPLVVPCLDVVRVFFHRISRRQSPFQPGRTHIHHKFLAAGMKQSHAMISILLLSIIYVVLNIIVSPWLSIDFILLIDFIIWVFGNYMLTKYIRRRQNQHPDEKNLYE